MADYYDNRSLLTGVNVPQMNIGDLTRAGSLATSALGSVRDREIENAKLAKDQARFEREQVLNKRVDDEFNREVGLRDARKKVASEFTANPYAASWGSGKETADLDKKVIDYVNSGGVIDENMARNLQARYEEARPFREDASNAIASRLISMGEDPTRAKQEAESLTSSMIGRADMQARLDAQRQAQQKVYDDEVKAKLEALKLGIDVNKANLSSQTDLSKAQLNANTDLAKLKWQAGLGGGAGTGGTGSGFGGNWYDAQQTVEKMDLGTYDTRTGAKPFLETARSMGYTPNQAIAALKNGVDIGVIDKTFDTDKAKDYLSRIAPMQNGGKLPYEVNPGSVGQIGFNVNAADLMPKYAPRQIAGYDPKGFLEGSRSTLPELFKNDPVVSEKVDRSVIGDKTGYNGSFTDAVKKIETSKPGGDYSSVNRIGAMGAYQFTPDTLDYINKVTGKNVSKQEFLNNPEIQDEYFKVLTNANKVVLSKNGVAPNDFNTWAAHNLGVGNVKKLLDVDTPADARLTKFIKSNLGEGIEPTKENYIKYYAPKFGTTLEEVTDPSNNRPSPLVASNQKYKEEFLARNPSGVSSPSSPRELFSKINTGVTDTKTKLAEGQKLDRLAEIDSILGSNPAPTPENIALINERESLIPKSGVGSFLNKVNREIINPIGAMLPAAGISKVPAMVDSVLGKMALKEATKSGKAIATTADDLATTISGGSRTAILNEKYIPRVQELVTKPFTPEVKRELLQIAEKLPGASRTEIMRYIQRAERIN